MSILVRFSACSEVVTVACTVGMLFRGTRQDLREAKSDLCPSHVNSI